MSAPGAQKPAVAGTHPGAAAAGGNGQAANFMYPPQSMMLYPGYFPGMPGGPGVAPPNQAFPMPYGFPPGTSLPGVQPGVPSANGQASSAAVPASSASGPSATPSAAPFPMGPMGPYGYGVPHQMFMQFPGVPGVPGAYHQGATASASPSPPSAGGSSQPAATAPTVPTISAASRPGGPGPPGGPHGYSGAIPGAGLPGANPPGYMLDPRMMTMMGYMSRAQGTAGPTAVGQLGALVPGTTAGAASAATQFQGHATASAAQLQGHAGPQAPGAPAAGPAAASASSASPSPAAVAAPVASGEGNSRGASGQITASVKPRDFSAPLSLSLFGDDEEEQALASEKADSRVPSSSAVQAPSAPSSKPPAGEVSLHDDDDDFGSFEGPSGAAASAQPAVAPGPGQAGASSGPFLVPSSGSGGPHPPLQAAFLGPAAASTVFSHVRVPPGVAGGGLPQAAGLAALGAFTQVHVLGAPGAAQMFAYTGAAASGPGAAPAAHAAAVLAHAPQAGDAADVRSGHAAPGPANVVPPSAVAAGAAADDDWGDFSDSAVAALPNAPVAPQESRTGQPVVSSQVSGQNQDAPLPPAPEAAVSRDAESSPAAPSAPTSGPAPAVPPASTAEPPRAAASGTRMALDEDLFSDFSALPAAAAAAAPSDGPARNAAAGGAAPGAVADPGNVELAGARANLAAGPVPTTSPLTAESSDDFGDFSAGAAPPGPGGSAPAPGASFGGTSAPAVAGSAASVGDGDDFGDFASPANGQSGPPMTSVPAAPTVPAMSTVTAGDGGGDNEFGDFSSFAPVPGSPPRQPNAKEDASTASVHSVGSPADVIPWGLHVGASEGDKKQRGHESLPPSASRREGSNAAGSKLVVGSGEDVWGVDWANEGQRQDPASVEADVGATREVIRRAAAAAAASAASSKKLVVGTDAYVVGIDWEARQSKMQVEEEKRQRKEAEREKARQGGDLLGEDGDGFRDFAGSQQAAAAGPRKAAVRDDDDVFGADDDDDFGDFSSGPSTFQAMAAQIASEQQQPAVAAPSSGAAAGRLVVGSGDDVWGIPWGGHKDGTRESPGSKVGKAASGENGVMGSPVPTQAVRKTHSTEGGQKSSLVVGTGEEVWGIKWDQPGGAQAQEQEPTESLKKTKSDGPKSSLMVGSGEEVWGIDWAKQEGAQGHSGGGQQGRQSGSEHPTLRRPTASPVTGSGLAVGRSKDDEARTLDPPKGSASGSLMVGSGQGVWGIDWAQKTDSDDFGDFRSSTAAAVLAARPRVPVAPASVQAEDDDDFGDFSSSGAPGSNQGALAPSGMVASSSPATATATAEAAAAAEGPREGPLSLSLFGDESSGHLENAELSLPGVALPAHKGRGEAKLGPTFGLSLSGGSTKAGTAPTGRGGNNLLDLLSQLYTSPPRRAREGEAVPGSVTLHEGGASAETTTSGWGVHVASESAFAEGVQSALTPRPTVTIVGDSVGEGPVAEKVGALLSAQADVSLWLEYADELAEAQATPMSDEDLFRDRSGEWNRLAEDLLGRGHVLEAFRCRNHAASMLLLPMAQGKMDEALDAGAMEEASKWRMLVKIVETNRASAEAVVRWREITSPDEDKSGLEGALWGGGGVGERGTGSRRHKPPIEEMAEKLGSAAGDPRAAALLDMFSQERLIQLARENLVAGVAESKRAEYVFRVLSAASAERVEALVQCWYALSLPCADILQSAAHLAEECTAREVSLEAVVGQPQGCKFFSAVAQALGVATALGATAQLYSSWLHAAPLGVGQSLWETLRRCQLAWNGSSPLRQAVRLALPRTDKALAWGDMRGALGMAETAAMQAAQEFLLPDPLTLPPLRCAFTLLPLLAFSSVSSVEWSGQRYLMPLANLWANKVSNKPPPAAVAAPRASQTYISAF